MSLTSKQRRRRQREDARVRSAETAAYARARRELERVVLLPPSTAQHCVVVPFEAPEHPYVAVPLPPFRPVGFFDAAPIATDRIQTVQMRAVPMGYDLDRGARVVSIRWWNWEVVGCP